MAAPSTLRARWVPDRPSLSGCHLPPKRSKAEVCPTMAKPPHILVVDDERSIRMMLEAGLTLNGFSVTTARTGKEALSALQTAAFDVVVSDIYMPDGDGLEVVRELRSLNSSVPIILITAQGSVELAVRAVEEGATDFIAKPFEVAAIAALLRRHLSAASEATNGGT